MTFRIRALLCTLLFSLGACGGDGITRAIDDSRKNVLAGGESFASTQSCTTLTKAATKYTGSTTVSTAVDSIAYNCRTEMCGNDSTAVDLSFVLNGNNTNNNDQITFRCRSKQNPNVTGGLQTWDSSQPCWNCVYGCATNCPAGNTCYPIPGTNGVDCTPYKCDVSDGKDWQLVQTYYGQPPVCQRTECPPPPITVSVDGPSSIRPGATCSWSATAGGGNGGPYTITWYVSSTSIGSGPYYDGGKPSGVVGSYWTLKAEVTDGTQTTTAFYPITESSSAPICPG